MTCPAVVKVVVPGGPAVVRVATPGPPGPPGPVALARLRRHDFAAPYSYCGTAPAGSAESAAVWTITRINVASNGATTVATATNATWTGRASATYS
jgi:hypothetical protein